ncbi:Diaphanous [Rhizophlyctis rosea]|uniref:Diaphanous n=1 Tax=Rhizophlyctis rosea TaxID=64517 RepID=A0AAD5X034_9FUNG|nr:Diaphanous [Rhizophlyctis rosea]
MRQLNWAKLPAQQITPSTVWKALADKPGAEEKLRKEKIDLKELEILFGVVGSGGGDSGKGGKDGKASKEKDGKEKDGKAEKGGEERSKMVTILDAKRANNISIMLGRIKLPYDQIRKFIIEMDTNQLPEPMVKQFLAAVPTNEEVETLKEFVGGNEAKLKDVGKAELFLWEMTKVPRLEQRLNAMLFKLRFLERVSDIRPDIAVLQKAATQLKSSKKLAQHLEIILAVGNYMNADSFRGGAWGFSIDTLVKLGDTKSTNNKTTFLHYLVQVIDSKFPELKDFAAELDALEKGARVSLPAINQEISELSRGFKDMENDLKAPPSGVKGDKFHETIKAFVDSNKSTFDTLKQQKADMEQAFKSVVEYFGEDVKSATPEAFLGTFAAFVRSLERARKDNEREAEAARKAAERAAKEEEKAKAKDKDKPPALLDADRKGVVDDLISSLKTGEAFRGKTKNRQRTSMVSPSRDSTTAHFDDGSGGFASRKPTLAIAMPGLGQGGVGRKPSLGAVAMPGMTEAGVARKSSLVPSPLSPGSPGLSGSEEKERKGSLTPLSAGPGDAKSEKSEKSGGLGGLGRKMTAGFKRT